LPAFFAGFPFAYFWHVLQLGTLEVGIGMGAFFVIRHSDFVISPRSSAFLCVLSWPFPAAFFWKSISGKRW
jgi:hypothetical protein